MLKGTRNISEGWKAIQYRSLFVFPIKLHYEVHIFTGRAVIRHIEIYSNLRLTPFHYYFNQMLFNKL